MKQDRIGDALLPASSAAGTRLGNALLWQPKYVRDEKILWHVPFLFWLLEATRPRQYVEIGVGEGVAYMAVCQALHRMRAHTQCFAVGDWKQGDGSVKIPERLAARNADLYEDFSQLLSDGASKAAKAIDNGSVDLMLLDLTQSPEAAASFHKRWLPKLSSRGILLVNGVDREDDATIGLVSALCDRSPTLRMPGGDGLLVVLPGRDPEEDLANIAALSPDDPAHKLIVQMFTRLGAGTYLQTHARTDEGKVQQLDEQVRTIVEERDRLAARLQELQAQYDARHRKVAILQARQFDLELASAAEAEGLRAQIAELKAQATELETRSTELLEAQSDELKTRTTELEAQIAELTQQIAQQSQQNQRLTDELAARRKKQEETAILFRDEQNARAEAELNARSQAEERLRESEADAADAKAGRDEALALLEAEKSARAEAEAVAAETEEKLREKAAQTEKAETEAAEANAERDRAMAMLEAARDSRDAAEKEAETLNGRLAELTVRGESEYRAVRQLVEMLEENENLVTALSEELRVLRLQVEASAAAEAEAASAASSESGRWFNRRGKRK